MVSNVDIKDLEEFNKLGLLVNDQFDKLFSLNELLNSDFDYVFGYYDDRLIAFIHVNKLYETMDIVNIVVDSEYRRRGIASELIRFSIDYFSDLQSVMLEVNEHNENAIRLYEKNGFEVISKREKYYGDDAALIMKRDV